MTSSTSGVTSTSSSTAATTAAATTSSSSSLSSILTTLGAGSGLDTSNLVNELVAASQDPVQEQLDAQSTTNSNRISALGTITSDLSTLNTSLASLISGGSLLTQPSVSDTSVMTATAETGSRLSNLSGSIQVKQLAQAQSISTGGYDTSKTFDAGSLTFTNSYGSATVSIDAGSSLSDVAKAINKKQAGFTATVLTQSSGQQQLMVTGMTGDAYGFSISGSGGVSDINYDKSSNSGSMTSNVAAQDAKLSYNNVDVTRSSNTFDDLVSGVSITLKSTSTQPVTLGSTRQTANVRQSILNFVDAYNQLYSDISTNTALGTSSTTAGVLANDSGVRTLKSSLNNMINQKLSSNGTYSTLGEVGVSINRDGTLSADTTQLDTALANDPDSVEALFNPTQSTSNSAVSITSSISKVTPGTYKLSDVTYDDSGNITGAKLNGKDMLVSGKSLIASSDSPAAGLVLKISGSSVTDSTISIDSGVGGAVNQLYKNMTATGGALTASSNTYSKVTTSIAKKETDLTSKMTDYRTRLTSQFTAMNTAVSGYKSTLSFLKQQVALWTNSSSSSSS
ncbi:MAG: flagellar filament capping protein FliD [Zymomonas mobilis]|uniref:Flagellar hook-associated protein 2 n=1 Tax=Zymomonas mobilis TaxID=542 RepID=A0A542W0J7_ZYMMB|nr:flagellar filament capping protein FliD [Zymomonas mobilis]TQL17111.1 flagellar hook-associated protein 2 [Zymomonas mobilis]